MNEAIESLPGEGDTKVVTKIQLRHVCDVCGEPAYYKHTFLLDGTRINPASNAYGQDDCSWCEDKSLFYCIAHTKPQTPSGYVQCSRFTVSKRFAHMFLYWKEMK